MEFDNFAIEWLADAPSTAVLLYIIWRQFNLAEKFLERNCDTLSDIKEDVESIKDNVTLSRVKS